MIDFIKEKLATPEGWVAAIGFIAKAIEYVTPDEIDKIVQDINYDLSSLIVSGALIYHFVKSGKKKSIPAI